jgi:sugar lactone lactonase YvrE
LALIKYQLVSRRIALLVLLACFASLVSVSQATPIDSAADHVLGQPNFESNFNAGLPQATTLNGPSGVAIDPVSGRLYVADNGNNRVLSWPSAALFTNGQAADRVIGQPNFTSDDSSVVSASRLHTPSSVAVDKNGNLFIVDFANNRVLAFLSPATSDSVADRVFGQADFGSSAPNAGGVGARSLSGPYGMALDRFGNLFVVDKDNHRVLEYDAPLTSDSIADRVFGQPNFTSNTPNTPQPSASTLNTPFGAAVDEHGNLYVADALNNRVLEYDAALTSDAIADRVYGQPDFSTVGVNTNGLSASSLNSPYSAAVDPISGNLFIADTFNHRVLEYTQPLTGDRAADRVFGQTSFTNNTPNSPGVGATTLQNPFGIAVDAGGRLFVADTFNYRVLSYDAPFIGEQIFIPLVMRS